MTDEYQDFLNSYEWKLVSIKIKSEHPFCEICGSKDQLVVHHKWYDDLLDENALVVLCRDCHECFHNGLNNYTKLYKNKHILLYHDAQDLLAEVCLDFYKNSFRKPDSNVNLLDANSQSKEKFCEFIKNGFELRLPGHKIFISDKTQCDLSDVKFTQAAKEKILRHRDQAVKNGIEAGIEEFLLKKQLKMSDSAFIKTLKRLDFGDVQC